ncbi:MAG: hypothetical protein ABI968_02295 [Acidobacteriota bacterium]
MMDRDRLELLRKDAHDAVWSGDYERALLLYEDGLRAAQSCDNRDFEDLFTCYRSVALMGRNARADEHFGALAEYYPDLPALEDLLRQVSLIELINLV